MTNIAAQKMVVEFLNKYPQRASEAFEDLEPEDRAGVFNAIEPSSAATLFKKANPEKIAKTLPSQQRFNENAAAAEPIDLVRVLNQLDQSERDTYLKKLPERLSKEVDAISSYPSDSAGSLMEVRILLFHPDDKVAQAITELRKIRARNISSIFLVDFNGALQGRVYLQDLIGAADEVKLKEISKPSPWVNEMAPKDEIVEIVEKNKVPSVPVLNNDNVVLGVIRYEQLVSIVHQDALDNIQKMVGVSKDEKALSPALFSVRKRLPWLTVNLLTTFVAAFVVGLFEDTIAKITALAVLLPVVAGQSGNTGAQAQAITMRGLALREIRMRHKWRVLVKEGTVGFVNGVAVGAMCSVSVFFWSQSMALALVIGSAMIFAMVAASLSGAAIPMLLTAIGQDPATSSSIILTTITDIVGFLSFLGLATIFGHYIV